MEKRLWPKEMRIKITRSPFTALAVNGYNPRDMADGDS